MVYDSATVIRRTSRGRGCPVGDPVGPVTMAYGAAMQGRLRLPGEPARDTTTVRVMGEVDLATSPQLRECLTGLDGIVVVDLSDVGFLDSSGLNALIGSK